MSEMESLLISRDDLRQQVGGLKDERTQITKELKEATTKLRNVELAIIEQLRRMRTDAHN